MDLDKVDWAVDTIRSGKYQIFIALQFTFKGKL